MLSSRKGFTLVEVLTVVVIFSIISSLVVLDFRSNGRTQRLQGAADELASRIKQAQGLAYSNTKQFICSTDSLVCKSGSACDAAYPVNCVNQYISRYGLAFNTDGTKTKYAIGADYAGIGNYAAGEVISNGLVKLPADIVIDTVNSVSPPTATVYDLSYVYDSANASPFIACSSNCLTTIVLRDNVSSKTKTISVQKQTGIVSVY